MDKIVIEGGRSLKGEIEVSGSKNAALPCLFSTLLTDEECALDNVPDLVDIDNTCALLEYLGKKIVRRGHRVQVLPGKKLKTEAPYELVRKMRASALVMGPLLARTGKASASMPGGCAIGVRPINIHIAGFEALGAVSRLSEGMVHLQARKLTGKRIVLDFPSVGATENLLMAAVLAEGETVIENAAREPEITDQADFLNAMGAAIEGAGTKTIRISGREKLHGASHRVIPDRIEAATYLIAAAVTRGRVTVHKAEPAHLARVLADLKKAGLSVKVQKDAAGTSSISCGYRGPVRPLSVVTDTYPGFPTDIQAQWMALMALAGGRSSIRESIFENRFLHAAELNRMGADIEIRGEKAFISGVRKLSGADVMVSDLRAGAALVIAGLAAEGRTVIHRVYHLDRGYEDLERKLAKLGARVKRVS